MPRKTKKEKMAAQLRKLKETVQVNETTMDGSVGPVSTIRYTPEISPKTVAEKSKLVDQFSSIYSDIKQVGLVIIVTVIFQVALSLTLRTNFAKLLLRSLGIEI